jgi:hypothetical protein
MNHKHSDTELISVQLAKLLREVGTGSLGFHLISVDWFRKVVTIRNLIRKYIVKRLEYVEICKLFLKRMINEVSFTENYKQKQERLIAS